MVSEKVKREQDLRKQEQELDRKQRVEEARLASERKKIEERKVELAKKEKDASGAVRVPIYWKNKSGFHRVGSKFVRQALQQFMVDSSVCCNTTKQVQVVSVERIENEHLWQMYQTRRKVLQKELAAHSLAMRKLSSKTRWQPDISSTAELVDGVNEFYLFHGTSSKMAQIISEYGFDERVANMGGLYGAGSYFACNACKSHQYTSPADHVMLVCRVTMGMPYCAQGMYKNERRPPDNAATPGRPFDSIFAEHGVANRGTQRHNEYVVFDRYQVYPEYIVRYRV